MSAWLKNINVNRPTFDYIRARKEGLFGAMSQLQVDSIEAILNECRNQAITLKTQIAYILATAYLEAFDYDGKSTGRIQRLVPIREKGSVAYLKSKVYYPFIGYGYVQITWLENYKKLQPIILEKFGVDILKCPEALLRIDVAAFVIVYGMKYGVFTKKKLSDFITSHRADFPKARAIVNGNDKAELIAGYAMKFLKCVI